MDHIVALEDMIMTLIETDYCTVYLEDGDVIEICPASEFVGGCDGFYMSDVIGNVEYDSAESICEEVLNFIDDRVIDYIDCV